MALTFDSRSGLLYYVDSGLNVTGVIAVKGKYHKTLVKYNNQASPQGIAIDTFTKFVYMNKRSMKTKMIFIYLCYFAYFLDIDDVCKILFYFTIF